MAMMRTVRSQLAVVGAALAANICQHLREGHSGWMRTGLQASPHLEDGAL